MGQGSFSLGNKNRQASMAGISRNCSKRTLALRLQKNMVDNS